MLSGAHNSSNAGVAQIVDSICVSVTRLASSPPLHLIPSSQVSYHPTAPAFALVHSALIAYTTSSNLFCFSTLLMYVYFHF